MIVLVKIQQLPDDSTWLFHCSGIDVQHIFFENAVKEQFQRSQKGNTNMNGRISNELHNENTKFQKDTIYSTVSVYPINEYFPLKKYKRNVKGITKL